MKYTTSAKNVEKCNLCQLGQVSFSFSGLFFAQGNPRETRYFLLILPKCKMVHYMKLTNICLTLLVNSFFLLVHFTKFFRICIMVHFGKTVDFLHYNTLRCIFVDNFSAQLSPQVTSGGCWLPSFALLHATTCVRVLCNVGLINHFCSTFLLVFLDEIHFLDIMILH